MIAPPGKGKLGLPGDLVAEPNTAGTHDAPFVIQHDMRTQFNALGLVDLLFFKPTVADAMRIGVVLKLAFARFVADGTIEGVVDEQEFHDRLSGLYDARIGRVNDHSVRHLRRTGDDEFGHLLHFDKTHPAVAGHGEIRMPAEVRDVDAVVPGRLNNRQVVFDLESFSVYGYCRHSTPLFTLLQIPGHTDGGISSTSRRVPQFHPWAGGMSS